MPASSSNFGFQIDDRTAVSHVRNAEARILEAARKQFRTQEFATSLRFSGILSPFGL